MDSVAIALATVLMIIAGVHFAWACGSNRPAKDEQALSNLVVGSPDAKEMPPKILTFIVSILIAVAAFWPLVWTAQVSYPHWVPQTIVWLGMWGLTLVFLIRGVGGYLPRPVQTVEPFTRMNTIAYSPLCVALGLGFLVLVLNP